MHILLIISSHFFREARYDEQIAITIVNYRVASKDARKGNGRCIFTLLQSSDSSHGDGDNGKARCTMCNRVASAIKSRDLVINSP